MIREMRFVPQELERLYCVVIHASTGGDGREGVVVGTAHTSTQAGQHRWARV